MDLGTVWGTMQVNDLNMVSREAAELGRCPTHPGATTNRPAQQHARQRPASAQVAGGFVLGAGRPVAGGGFQPVRLRAGV